MDYDIDVKVYKKYSMYTIKLLNYWIGPIDRFFIHDFVLIHQIIQY